MEGNGSDLMEGEEVDVVSDFLNEQFREIDDDTAVRSQFKVDDLRLLRREGKRTLRKEKIM